jgi:hypothetical protein
LATGRLELGGVVIERRAEIENVHAALDGNHLAGLALGGAVHSHRPNARERYGEFHTSTSLRRP